MTPDLTSTGHCQQRQAIPAFVRRRPVLLLSVLAVVLAAGWALHQHSSKPGPRQGPLWPELRQLLNGTSRDYEALEDLLRSRAYYGNPYYLRGVARLGPSDCMLAITQDGARLVALQHDGTPPKAVRAPKAPFFARCGTADFTRFPDGPYGFMPPARAAALVLESEILVAYFGSNSVVRYQLARK